MYEYMYLALTLCAGFGFIYGLVRLVMSGKAPYTHMIVYGLGCVMIGRLFQTVSLFAFGELTNGFNIGMLGIVGSFLFFFTANYGQMDSLVDDGTPKFQKTRLMALAAPAVIFILFAIYIHYTGIDFSTFVRLAGMMIIAVTSYYHLKHILIEDVDFGLIKSLRRYNILALALAVLCVVETIASSAPFSPLFLMIVLQLTCIVYLLIIPELEKGVMRWTI